MPIETIEDDGIILVTLNLPEQRNALGPDDAARLADVLAGADPKLAMILTGRGAFCAGGDLRAFSAKANELSEEGVYEVVYSAVQRVVRELRACSVPTIAAIDGPAIGLGMDLALACDMRFVGPEGWLRQGWGSAGLVAGAGGVALLERLNPTVLWELLAEQPKLDGAACQRLGLAENAPDGAMTAAVGRARALAAIPDDVRRAYVDLSRAGWPAPERFEAAARYQAHFIHSEEFKARAEAILAQARSAANDARR